MTLLERDREKIEEGILLTKKVLKQRTTPATAELIVFLRLTIICARLVD